MTRLEVWAPKAKDVEVTIAQQRLPMVERADGWWYAEQVSLAHGDDYAFFIDGVGPFPDPRSPWQPEGVHGRSRHLEHDRFAWGDANWQPPPLSSAVIYELHLGTFTPAGTCDAAIEKLDYLVDLGVTHLEIMPVNAYAGDYGWGYDGVSLYAPHCAYGSPEALKRLVDACHRQGIAVILDVVYNHLGPSGNYLSQFAPYFIDKYVTPWGEAVNLDAAHSGPVRRFFIDNALMWLRDYHFDGLRLDAVHAMLDESATHFLEQLAVEVEHLEHQLGRHLYLIAETDLNNPRLIRSREVGGYGLHAQWNEDFHHALQSALTGDDMGYYQDFGKLKDLHKVLTEGAVLDGCYCHYRQRAHGRPLNNISGRHFIGCMQNHDQVGNRACGDRIGHIVSPGKLKVGAALVMTAPFVPMIFQGEEWNASTPFIYFSDHREPELAEAVRHGRRREFAAFGWPAEDIPDPQAESSFRDSQLRWHELEAPHHNEILQWYKALIALRHAHPCLRHYELSGVRVSHDEQSQWLYLRRGAIVVLCNFNTKPVEIPGAELSAATLLLGSQNATDLTVKSAGVIMPAESVFIFQTAR